MYRGARTALKEALSDAWQGLGIFSIARVCTTQLLYENPVLLIAFFGNEIIHHAVVCHSASPKIHRASTGAIIHFDKLLRPLLLIVGSAQERKGTREQLTQGRLAFVQ